MYYFFDNISQLKEYAGGGANVSVELASMEVGLYAAYNNHVRDFISEPLWQELQTAAGHEAEAGNWLSAGQVPDIGWETDEEDFTAAQVKLLPYLRRALALLSLYEYSKVNDIQMSEAGLMRVENENMRSAYRYQINEYRDFFLTQGYEAIETMLEFLTLNSSDYEAWEESPARSRHMSILLNTASAFRRAYSLSISRHTYEIVRPLIEDLESFALVSFLGKPQYEALLDNFNTTTLEDQLIEMLRRSVANSTIQEALRRNWVHVKGNQVVQADRLAEQGYQRELPANWQSLAAPIHFHKEWAARHLSHVKAFLQEHLDDFPLYEAHIEAQAAAKPQKPYDPTKRIGAVRF